MRGVFKLVISVSLILNLFSCDSKWINYFYPNTDIENTFSDRRVGYNNIIVPSRNEIIVDDMLEIKEEEVIASETPPIDEMDIFKKYSGVYELPVIGATGYAAIDLPLYGFPAERANVIRILDAGQGFTILMEELNWWYIDVNNIRGWVKCNYCMINIPDIIPSIIHNNTNTYSSLFRSSGFNIPNITGRILYSSRDFNARLFREEYIAPVLYGMAGKIYDAQKAALAEGNSLIIYEAFRPTAAHDIVYDELLRLAGTNTTVFNGMNTPPYSTRWFLLPAPFNHQRGTAIDVSLARVIRSETRISGIYEYLYITDYEEYRMQTPMHELSIQAVVFRDIVSSVSETAWLQTEFARNTTDGTKIMHKYLTDAGLTPLASEWWHFNDLPYTRFATLNRISGRYLLDRTYSIPPVNTAPPRNQILLEQRQIIADRIIWMQEALKNLDNYLDNLRR
ncbi:MAG: hypothetical protein FWC21_07035 [Treponema sp.]|nr:hypothetical protein [Treponema sp.]